MSLDHDPERPSRGPEHKYNEAIKDRANLMNHKHQGKTMYHLPRLINDFINDEEGATVVEYGVLIALVIAACVIIIGTLGQKIDDAFTDVDTKFGTALGS